MPEERKAPWITRAVQHALAAAVRVLLVLPYRRTVRGAAPQGGPRRIIVSNHVSLLDTPMIAVHLPRPVLVLGDRATWSRSWFRRFVSARVGFFIDRDNPTKERLRQLAEFGREIGRYTLLVFPEGHRGDGVNVQECQPGIYYVARAARAPIVPVFLENMQLVSGKQVSFRPLGGLRKVVLHFGSEIEPDEYEGLDRDALCALVRARIQALARS